MNAGGDKPLRLVEFVASLSLATDLGMGQPMDHAIGTCLLSARAARALGLTGDDLSDTYYLSLLRFIGCTADAHQEAASVGGDEIALRGDLATVIMAETPEFMRFMLRSYAADQKLVRRLRLLAAAMAEGTGGAKRSIAEHCEVAQMLVTRMGLSRRVGDLVGQVFERWDGKGIPGELAGDAIPAPARIAAVARDVEVFNRLGGWSLAADVLTRRRGRAYDPAVTGVMLEQGEAWLAEIAETPAWDAVIAAEPAPPVLVEEARVDEVLRAFADFVDLKSHYTTGHSTRVAELAGEAAKGMGLDPETVLAVRRAGYVHDLGKAGVPNGVWDKAGSLTEDEWERVRLHPYLTERILSRSRVLQPLASLASAHHERLDGSGYFKGLGGTSLPRGAMVLAAADAYQAMTQAQPYRPALERDQIEREMQREVAAGRLDREAVHCVLMEAGYSVRRRRATLPAGLTEREAEVLRMISRGYSNKEVAGELTLSTKTVGRHIENIYGKIGVSSRAAAALFAMEHHLVHS